MWKPVVDYEGLYEVGSDGYVKRLKREIVLPNGAVGIVKEHIMERTVGTDGYLYVTLCKNNKAKKCAVHRLVAVAFIPNPLNLPEVNHKDEIKTNPKVENLEWCDRIYNENYGTKKIREAIKRGHPIDRYSMDGKFIDTWPSEAEFTRAFGYNGSDLIRKVCKHYKGYSSAYGYKWKYHGDTSDFNHSTRGKPIVQCSLDGEYIEKFRNAKEASEKTGICHTSIRRCAKGIHKTAGGFVWKEISNEKD